MSNSILKDRNFISYLLMAFFIRAGDAIYKIVLILYIIKMGGTAGSVGTIIILNLIPSALLGPISGIFSDRYNSKFIIHAANIVRIITLVLIPISHNIWLLYMYSFILAASTLFAAPTQKVMLSLLVEKSQIPSAAGYLASTRSIIDTLIPIFGSGLAVLIGFTETFYLNAGFYLISSLLIISLKLAEQTHTNKTDKKLKVYHEILDGFKYLFSIKKLKIITFTSIVTLALSAGLNVLIPIYILIDLNYSDTTYGFLIGALGAGIVLGGFLVPRLKKKWNLSVLFIFGFSIVIDGSSFLFFSYLAHSLIASSIIMILCGISSAGFMIMLDSFMQTEVDQKYLGRTYSSLFSLTNIFSVLVMGIVTVLADVVSITSIFITCSIGILLTGVFTVYLNQSIKKAELSSTELKG